MLHQHVDTNTAVLLCLSGCGVLLEGGVHARGGYTAAAGVPAAERGGFLLEEDGGYREQVCFHSYWLPAFIPWGYTCVLCAH